MFTDLFELEKKTVTVFNSEDVDAPVLLNDYGSLPNIFDKCLITGYGTKSPLGWKKAFTGSYAYGAVYQSQDISSSKYFLKIDDYNSASEALISTFKTMADYDTGVNQLGTTNTFRKYNNAKWCLIGHSKAFIFIIATPTNSESLVLLFGDLPKQKTRDTPIVVYWQTRVVSDNYSRGGVQLTLGYNMNGNTSTSTTSTSSSSSYNNHPFVTNGGNITKAYSKFKSTTHFNATAPLMYDPYIFCMSDSTWSMLPMLQPLSSQLNDVGNLGYINTNAIKINTSNRNDFNAECAVPTDWWWA